MTLRTRIALLAAVLAVAGLVWAAPEKDAAAKYKLKPGASGKLCLDCHVDFQDTVKKAFVHTPVKSGNCADCHDPHAADHGKLLAEAPSAICQSCHADIVPKGAMSTHQAALEGKCIDCHDPHASDFKSGLKATGNAVCASCHKAVVDGASKAAHKHAPVEGDCLGCHDPHASKDAPALLTKAVPGLCVGCHQPTKPTFAREHLGYPVAGTDCTSCHDPHGSKNEGLLWANVHEPVANKMCAQCHEAADSAQPLAVKKPGGELCRGCHNELYNESATKARLHWPMVDREACANCHNPHASKVDALLAAPQRELCGSCHGDVLRRGERSVTKHQPVAEGDCTTCHTPHASNEPGLFAAANEEEMCGSCHDWKKHSAHPLGPKAVDQRNPNLTVGCNSCHRNHGTQEAHFAPFEPKQALCMNCHTKFTR